ncbi:MAG: metallophosphoesterase [Acidobacteriota bacterium]
MADRRRRHVTFVALGLALLVGGGLSADPRLAEGTDDVDAQVGTAKRVIAIGDVHGALDPLHRILQEVGVTDSEHRWIGGSTILVQTGDVLDRGSKVREVVAFLRALQEQAEQAGGQVIVLLGNHEALNLIYDLRDVNERIVRHFAARNTDARRTKFCEDKVDTLRRRARRAGATPPDRVAAHARCMETTPKGWLEYVDALAPDGEIGAWMRTLPAAARVGDLLFVHGGFAPDLPLDMATINARVADEIAVFDSVRAELLDRELIFEDSQLVEIHGAARALLDRRRRALDRRILDVPRWLLVAPEGPLWFRGYAQWNEDEGLSAMRRVVDQRKARAVIVGHTPQRDKSIQRRFDGRAYLIDTGMLESVYGGRPAALEFAGDRVTAVYLDGREDLSRGSAEARGEVAIE